jgi:malate dehydrogenase (oxaloacetate-decarboxylating)(NADP+)
MGIPILLGRREVIKELMIELDFDSEEVTIIDPKSDEEKGHLENYANQFWKARQRKGVTLYDAQKLLRERNYFAAMMVQLGDADAMLSGYSRAYPTVVKPILEIIGKLKGVTKVATCNLMNTSKGPIFISDTSINIDPTAKDLAKIAQMTNHTVKMFGMEAIIAMVSYANFGSSKDAHATKVREAVDLLHKVAPDVIVDGELQVDFALNRKMREEKFPFSKLSNRKVNTLIYPTLDSANGTYKLIKELTGEDSIGPIMMGLEKPAHVIQLGASVEEMVNMAAVAIVDAQDKQKRQQMKLEIQ